jgi:hypothetical protein
MELKVHFALAERQQKVNFDSAAGSQEMKKDLVSNWMCFIQQPKKYPRNKMCLYFFIADLVSYWKCFLQQPKKYLCNKMFLYFLLQILFVTEVFYTRAKIASVQQKVCVFFLITNLVSYWKCFIQQPKMYLCNKMFLYFL